jgi:hypothetical protein
VVPDPEDVVRELGDGAARSRQLQLDKAMDAVYERRKRALADAREYVKGLPGGSTLSAQLQMHLEQETAAWLLGAVPRPAGLAGIPGEPAGGSALTR